MEASKEGAVTEKWPSIKYRDLPGPTPEQKEAAVAAAARRDVDPLIQWTRPPRDDCPICLIPLPLDMDDEGMPESQTCYRECCGTTVCGGCVQHQWDAFTKDCFRRKGTFDNKDVAGRKRVMRICPFCRHEQNEKEDEQIFKQQLKLAEAGRPKAKYHIATRYLDGAGLRRDEEMGMNYLRLAAEAGSSEASQYLGLYYLNGMHGLDKDFGKALEHLDNAASQGEVQAFGMAGGLLLRLGEIDDAMLSFRKAAICGMVGDVPMLELRNGFRAGYITKDEYAYTLRENQASREEMKSEMRDLLKVQREGRI